MLYKSENKIYVFASNKYFELENKNNNLVPSNNKKYELKNKKEISYEDALRFLQKDKDIEVKEDKNKSTGLFAD